MIGGGAAAGGLGGGPEEQRGLEALAGDRDERGEGQREGAHQQGGVELVLQLGLEEPRGAAHPEDHPGHEDRPR